MKNSTLNSFLILGALCTMFFSCGKKTSRAISKDELKGHWKSEYAGQGIRYAGEDFELWFDGDSFKMDRSRFTDVITVDSPCNFAGWHDYANGTYNIENDNLMLTGAFKDSSFRQNPDTSCSQKSWGQYYIRFTVIDHRPDIITMKAVEGNSYYPQELLLKRK